MSPYATELQSAKLLALAALTTLLAATEDPIEKRRIATTILRIPTPPATDRSSERSVAATPDSPSTQDHATSPSGRNHALAHNLSLPSAPSPHPTSDITHPTSLPPLSDLESRLDKLHTELDHHLAHLLNSIPDTSQPPLLSSA